MIFVGLTHIMKHVGVRKLVLTAFNLNWPNGKGTTYHDICGLDAYNDLLRTEKWYFSEEG